MGEGDTNEYDIFDDAYLAKIEKIKLPNTKIKLLQQLLAKAIGEFKKVNKVKGGHKLRRRPFERPPKFAAENSPSFNV